MKHFGRDGKSTPEKPDEDTLDDVDEPTMLAPTPTVPTPLDDVPVVLPGSSLTLTTETEHFLNALIFSDSNKTGGCIYIYCT